MGLALFISSHRHFPNFHPSVYTTLSLTAFMQLFHPQPHRGMTLTAFLQLFPPQPLIRRFGLHPRTSKRQPHLTIRTALPQAKFIFLFTPSYQRPSSRLASHLIRLLLASPDSLYLPKSLHNRRLGQPLICGQGDDQGYGDKQRNQGHNGQHVHMKLRKSHIV